MIAVSAIGLAFVIAGDRNVLVAARTWQERHHENDTGLGYS